MYPDKHIANRWNDLPIQYHYEVNQCIPYPVLQVTLVDAHSNQKMGQYEISYSRHSFQRSSQRGFNAADLLNVLNYGEQIERQGMVFHIIRVSNLPQYMARFAKDKMQEWVVVTNADQTIIITCYKAKRAFKNIRRKSKYLL